MRGVVAHPHNTHDGKSHVSVPCVVEVLYSAWPKELPASAAPPEPDAWRQERHAVAKLSPSPLERVVAPVPDRGAEVKGLEGCALRGEEGEEDEQEARNCGASTCVDEQRDSTAASHDR